jgi:hypothetical protein
VYLQTRSITASKFARSRPPSASPNSLDYGLQVRTITAFQVHLQTCSTTAAECISKFTRSRYGEALELESRQPIINTPAHLAWHPKGIREKERFWFEERRMRVRGCGWIPSHDEPHKLRGSMKARQGCMRPRAGKDRVCISYNEMSIYSEVFQIYTSCR